MCRLPLHSFYLPRCDESHGDSPDCTRSVHRHNQQKSTTTHRIARRIRQQKRERGAKETPLAESWNDVLKNGLVIRLTIHPRTLWGEKKKKKKKKGRSRLGRQQMAPRVNWEERMYLRCLATNNCRAAHEGPVTCSLGQGTHAPTQLTQKIKEVGKWPVFLECVKRAGRTTDVNKTGPGAGRKGWGKPPPKQRTGARCV